MKNYKKYVPDSVLSYGISVRGVETQYISGFGVRIGPVFYGKLTFVRAFASLDSLGGQRCFIETWSERVGGNPQVEVCVASETWPKAFDAFVAKWREFEGQCLTQGDVTP